MGVFLKVWRPLKLNRLCGVISFLSSDLILQPGVTGMTDFDIDTQDILSLLIFVTGNVPLLLDHGLLRRRRELALALMGGVHRRCSTLMETTSEEKEEEMY